MIKEICQFVETLEEQAPDLFKEGAKLKEGIYVALDIGLNDGKYELRNVDENGNILKEDIQLYSKGKEMNPQLEETRKVMIHTPRISVNKSFNSSDKFFIATCNPFTIGFSKKNYEKKVEEQNGNGKIEKALNAYFKAAEKYVVEDQLEIFHGFKDIIARFFWDIILKQIDLIKLKANTEVVLFCKHVSYVNFENSYSLYLKDRLFNKKEYNIPIDNETYGIADNLSTFTDSKSFLKHRTASFDLNFRITTKEVLKISKFYRLLGSNLPNPLPIFVNSEEAESTNAITFQLFNKDGIASYTEIIKRLHERQGINLQNFYLIFSLNKQIIDLDFVPFFRYKIDYTICNLMGIKDANDYKLRNVFDLEKELNKAFTKNHRDSGIGYGFLLGNYFTEKVDSQKSFKKYLVPSEILSSFYKYKTSIYEYIYKSKLNAITPLMFDDMMLSSILSDIHCDQFKDNYHSKDFSIKEKINLWFSLYDFFALNENLIRIDMKENLKQHREMMQELIDGKRDIHTDEEFAFAAGQTIYYILSKSVSADKSYSRLELFLQKSEYSEFKKAIVRIFDMYKHENFSNKFSKSMAQVMAYNSDENLKELTPYMLAGFFAKNLLFSDKNQINSEQ
jgi:CRISPR-associated protein Csh1